MSPLFLEKTALFGFFYEDRQLGVGNPIVLSGLLHPGRLLVVDWPEEGLIITEKLKRDGTWIEINHDLDEYNSYTHRFWPWTYVVTLEKEF